MSELRELLKEEYGKKQKATVTPQSLMEMIEEIIEYNFNRPSQIKEEKEPSLKTPQSMEFTYQAIPEIPVSEIGWASLHSNDEAGQAKRQQLEQFLAKIKGKDLRVKIKNLSRILSDPKQFQTATYGSTPRERIANILSYLVFFKTLTTVITNFNASSAGFNFESFLAVLLGGYQIPAAGASTIADLRTGEGVPVSLKLYNEKTLKAGGSYHDLVSDLARRPNMMQYVVATKTLTGKELATQGEIGFYQYNLTLDNICQILYNSARDDNDHLIRLPQAVLERQRGTGSLRFKIPTIPTVEEIGASFEESVRNTLRDQPFVEDLIAAINYLNSPSLFTGPKKPALGHFVAQNREGTLIRLLKDLKSENVIPEQTNLKELFLLLNNINEEARRSYLKAKAAIDKIRGSRGAYASPRKSLKFYNGLSGAEKQRALLLTLGYARGGLQYELTRADIYTVDRLAQPYSVFAPRQKSVRIGELEIGRARIQDILNEVVDQLNSSVFQIFSDLKMLNDNIQAFFAGGLADDRVADTAIEAAESIGERTKEFKSDEK